MYAIKSATSQRVYVGQTSDLEDRMKRHNSGEVQSTRKDVPWKLVAVEEFKTRSQAMWKEMELKNSRGKRVKWLEQNRLITRNEPTPRREGHTGNNSQRQWIG